MIVEENDHLMVTIFMLPRNFFLNCEEVGGHDGHEVDTKYTKGFPTLLHVLRVHFVPFVIPSKNKTIPDHHPGLCFFES